MKNVNGRARTKPSPILVLDYGFDYKLQICGQISFGMETFPHKFQYFFFKNDFSVFPPHSNTFSFGKCLKVYIKQWIWQIIVSFKLPLVASLTGPGTGYCWNVTRLLVFYKNTLSDERCTVWNSLHNKNITSLLHWLVTPLIYTFIHESQYVKFQM